MWVAGFSIDNLSLMALAVSVGFVVDDAIVMIENVFRNLEKGYSPLRATIEGARQIGFTVVSISVSLVAAFIPLLFMSGVVGRLFREFSVTLCFAIAISTVVSLTVTPMICAHFVRAPPSPDATAARSHRRSAYCRRMIAAYAVSLGFVLRHRILTMLVFLATIALTVDLYIKTPKGYFPQDDTGLIFGGTRASPDISFEAMKELQQRVTEIVLSDPAVAAIGSSVGASGFNASVNQGRLFISLKPLGGARHQLASLHQPHASEAARRRRHAGVHDAGAGRARRRAAIEFDLSVHVVGPQPRRAAERWCRACWRACSSCRSWPMSTPTASRAACRPMW